MDLNKKFVANYLISYDVPSMCSVKERKSDFETFETALDTLDSVLFGVNKPEMMAVKLSLIVKISQLTELRNPKTSPHPS